jgi:hypothetical protein
MTKRKKASRSPAPPRPRLILIGNRLDGRGGAQVNVEKYGSRYGKIDGDGDSEAMRITATKAPPNPRCTDQKRLLDRAWARIAPVKFPDRLPVKSRRGDAAFVRRFRAAFNDLRKQLPEFQNEALPSDRTIRRWWKRKL